MIVHFAAMMGRYFKLCTLFVLLAAFVDTSESANILGIFPSTSPSHNIVHLSYVRALIERGHNVTVISAIPLKDKNPKYHHILIPVTMARSQELADMKTQIAEHSGVVTKIKDGVNNIFLFTAMFADTLKDQRFQDLLQNPDNKFDLVLLGFGYFFNSFYVGVGAHFRCPVVISYLNAPSDAANRLIGNPMELSYVPASQLFELPDFTTFKGRLANFLINIPASLANSFMDYLMKGVYNDFFPSTDYPSYADAKKKVSLILFNYHFTEGIVRPNVPAVVECSGVQIKDKPDPLPENLQKVFNASSEHGVIYVSFGSNLGINEIRSDILNPMFKVLSGLKQTVLWKWGDVETPGTASNIHYSSWLPQDDILQHPNLKLFITHAGKGSVTEAAYHGVPMLAVPMMADQFGNADQMVKSGYGLKVDREAITEDLFKQTVLEVLNNPKYTESVKRFSSLTKDRPMTPKQTAIFWLEYVMRHKGAYHMQSPAVHMNMVQLCSLDVIGFLLLMAFIVCKLITIPLKFVYRKLMAKKFSKDEKIKNE